MLQVFCVIFQTFSFNRLEIFKAETMALESHDVIILLNAISIAWKRLCFFNNQAHAHALISLTENKILYWSYNVHSSNAMKMKSLTYVYHLSCVQINKSFLIILIFSKAIQIKINTNFIFLLLQFSNCNFLLRCRFCFMF